MGTDLRIIQRVTKIIKEAGDTLTTGDKEDYLDLLIKLRHAGALGEADVKRIRSTKRTPDHHQGYQLIDNALKWGADMEKLGIIRLDDGSCMVYLKPLTPIVDEDHELPGAQAVEPALFKPLKDYGDAADPSIYKHISTKGWQLATSFE